MLPKVLGFEACRHRAMGKEPDGRHKGACWKEMPLPHSMRTCEPRISVVDRV